MTQISLPWDAADIGDALALAPYWAGPWTLMMAEMHEQTGSYGVLIRSGNGLFATLAGGNDSPCTVDTGAAAVGGQYFNSSVAEALVIPRPIALTRYDNIVVRRIWATKTTRITRVAGIEGGGLGLLTWVWGTTWDVPIASIEVPVAGAMVISDKRLSRHYPDVTERQGSDLTNWDEAGTVWYQTGKVKMVCGSSKWVGVATNNGTKTITFNHVFAKPPLVFIVQTGAVGVANPISLGLWSVFDHEFTWRWDSNHIADTYAVQQIAWLAIGEE